MSSLVRIIIGAIIIISAFQLYNNSEERYQFHSAVRQIAKLVGRCLGCYKCIELYRQIVVIFVLTGGVSLLIDTGVFVGILAHLLISALQFASFNGQLTLVEIQTLLVNVAILLFLLKNWSEEKEEQKAQQAKAAEAANQAQKSKVEAQKSKVEGQGNDVKAVPVKAKGKGKQ